GTQFQYTPLWHCQLLQASYWISKRSTTGAGGVALGRAVYSWAGTGLMAWVLYEAVSAPWIAVAWIGFAIALALVVRWISYSQLGWQANVIAACALVRTCTFNYGLQQTTWQGISLRLITVSVVAAGLYFLSRAATVRGSESARAITSLQNFSATALLALLAWYEVPGGRVSGARGNATMSIHGQRRRWSHC